MDKCPRCGGEAVFAGYEDARTFYQCQNCKRVWTVRVAESMPDGPVPLTVLVADDSDLLVGLVATWLEDEGYAAVTATTGQQALDAAIVSHPDVVLLDLIMPPPDGFDVCERLLRLPRAPEVILMTGVSDATHLQRAMDLGAGTLLRKPLAPDLLIAAVASAARRRTKAARESGTGG